MFTVHSQLRVDLLGRRVALVDVQADAADGRLLDHRLHVVVQTRVNAAAPKFGDDVHALNPPDHAVAPVAPFVGDHQRADDPFVAFGDVVAAEAGVGENCVHAAG